MSNDVLSVVSSLGSDWSTVDILGWSMGGHILQRLLTRPESTVTKRGTVELLKGKVEVRKAILAATMTKMPRGDINMAQMQEEAGKIKDGKKRKRWATEQMLAYQYDVASLEKDERLNKIMQDRIEVSLQTTRPQEMIALQAGAIGQYRSRDDLGRIPDSVPVLIIHGKLDRMVHYKESEPLEKGITHAKRVDLSDGVKQAQEGQYGHFVSHPS
jgi:alpha-beta hydrolase superfamily lysophospholipase